MYFTISVHNKIFCFNINLLIIFTFFNISQNFIILPFKTTKIFPNAINIEKDNEIEKILSIINSDIIYTPISFGTSSSIDFYFSMEQYPTSINQNICFKGSESSYNPYDSESIKKVVNNLYNEKCSIYKDINLTENITINSFLFYLNKSINNGEDFISNINEINYLKENNRYCGIIGLSRYPYISEHSLNSFIYNLKKYNYINSYSFGFFFFNNENKQKLDEEKTEHYDGFFIAGISYDDNIDIFDTNLASTVYAEEDTLNWAVNFERIFYYQKINETIEYISTNNTKVEFITDLNYIVSDEKYYTDIKKYYFQKFFDNNTCFEENAKLKGINTFMIICNIKFKENMGTFPGIYFYREQFFFAFNLKHEDLFYEYNNKIYFLIMRKENIVNYWKIGKIFLKKYPFIFDYDKKIVSYVYLNKEWNPNKTPKNKNNLSDKNSINKNAFNKEYSIYFFLIIGVIIGIFIGKRIWSKKKKLKANELEEQYKYYENKSISDNNGLLNAIY